VDELLRLPELAALAAREGHVPVKNAARSVLAQLRERIGSGKLAAAAIDPAVSGLSAAVERQVQQDLGLSLRAVINATGVILHTNLGRAPLSAFALEHLTETAAEYSNLEFELETGERGKRDMHVERLFRRLLSAKSEGAGGDSGEIFTIVVNNNAAAVWLALNTLAAGGEAMVSRGELIEIGGSFRIPDVMAQSNAILREVGTTNRTRIGDYERAINDKTRVLLRVHRSNFEIRGFTEQPPVSELVALARRRRISLVEDLGSGAFLDLASVGVQGEPGVADSLKAGVDVVTYSGDKLLGGPQCGMLSGRAELIQRMRRNSLFRALRVDKLTYSVLEATLLAYIRQDYDAIPALRMLRLPKEEIGERAMRLAHRLEKVGDLSVGVVEGESVIGGGAAPSAVLPTRLVAVKAKNLSADQLLAGLRRANPPVIARVGEERVLIDLRTVFPEQDEVIAKILAGIAS
jgi:L-seryl-tRNA(Ser) seleniumtransferase